MTIKLVNIFTHEYGATQLEKQCTVYNNGIMRLAVWAEVQYQDEAEDAVISDVQSKLVIYHGLEGDMSTWMPQHGEAGIYDHDLTSSEQKAPSAVGDSNKAYSITRVPVYFTVPQINATAISILAKYDGVSISVAEAIDVTVVDFDPSGFQIKFNDVGERYSTATLRKLHIDMPSNHHFVDWEPLGVSFGYYGENYYGPVMSMLRSESGHKAAIFVRKNNKIPAMMPEVALTPDYYYGPYAMMESDSSQESKKSYTYAGQYYTQGYTDFINQGVRNVYTEEPACFMDNTLLPLDLVKNIFDEGGIPMFLFSHSHLHMLCTTMDINGKSKLSFEDPVHTLTDNFGNKIKITIDWDAGDWWGTWAVTRVEKA